MGGRDRPDLTYSHTTRWLSPFPYHMVAVPVRMPHASCPYSPVARCLSLFACCMLAVPILLSCAACPHSHVPCWPIPVPLSQRWPGLFPSRSLAGSCSLVPSCHVGQWRAGCPL